MKVRTIPTWFVAATQRQGSGLAILAIMLVLLPPAAAQQYPPPGYPGSAPPPGYPGAAQPPGYPGPTQPPAYSGPGYGGPTTPPPPLQQEAVPPPPRAAMVWTPGYWSWGHRGWTWVEGRYVARPYPHAAWVPGHWRPRDQPGCGSRDIGGDSFDLGVVTE
jgi:WXXGXW repeat (2 copies)